MIRTKHFTDTYGVNKISIIDKNINTFIETNKISKIIDLSYQSTKIDDYTIHISALLTYDDV